MLPAQTPCKMDRGCWPSTRRHLQHPPTMVSMTIHRRICLNTDFGIVSQHINSITLTNAPAFPQQDYYNTTHHSAHPHSNQVQYSEYDQQLQYLATANNPQDDSGYWENTRNDAVRMLNEQAGPYVSSTSIYSPFFLMYAFQVVSVPPIYALESTGPYLLFPAFSLRSMTLQSKSPGS